MASRCGCGSATCTCLVRGGTGITVTGSGSQANPYIVTATAGGSCPGPMTIAELIVLRDGGLLDPCVAYVVTDWNMGPSSFLPGPNLLVAYAAGANSLMTGVDVYTPLAGIGTGNTGPNRGSFLWDLAVMTELSDPLGNHIVDLTLSTLIGDFPWGNTSFSNNEIRDSVFSGGYAVTSVAAAVGNMINCALTDTTIDLAGSGGWNILRSRMTSGSLTVGLACTISASEFIGSTVTGSTTGQLTVIGTEMKLSNVTLTNAGSLLINDGTLNNSTINLHSAGSNAFDNCELINTTVQDSGPTATTRPTSWTNVRAIGSTYTSSRTGGASAQLDQWQNCAFLDANITIAGAVNPGASQNFYDNLLQGGATVAISDPAGNCSNNVVQAGSTLNVNAGGRINDSRISCAATLSTGAFTHDTVIVDGNFTVTLTANNTNTLKNKGYTDVI